MSEGTELTRTQPAQDRRLIIHDDSPTGVLFDTAKFEQLQKVCRILSASAFTPQHLKGKNEQETIANCFRVANQALRWNMDPFAVADETYVVKGKLGYQGKLVIAVVNSRAGLKGRLDFKYSGSGDKRTVTVTGRFMDDEEPKSVEVELGKVKTDNKMWVSDPDQKLAYTGATKWARRYCPEVLTGVLTVEDLEQIQAERTLVTTEELAQPVSRTLALEDKLKRDDPVRDAQNVSIAEEALREAQEKALDRINSPFAQYAGKIFEAGTEEVLQLIYDELIADESLDEDQKSQLAAKCVARGEQLQKAFAQAGTLFKE